MNLVPNGGLGSSKVSTLTKNTFHYAVYGSLEKPTSVQAKEA